MFRIYALIHNSQRIVPMLNRECVWQTSILLNFIWYTNIDWKQLFCVGIMIRCDAIKFHSSIIHWIEARPRVRAIERKREWRIAVNARKTRVQHWECDFSARFVLAVWCGFIWNGTWCSLSEILFVHSFVVQFENQKTHNVANRNKSNFQQTPPELKSLNSWQKEENVAYFVVQ